MRYTIIPAVLLILNIVPTYPQNQLKAYTILGQEITCKPSSIVIYYNTISCHACMELLLSCCKEITQQDSSINLYILIEGSDYIGTMRSSTTSLLDYASAEEMPKVIYDLNPTIEQCYKNQFNISMSPSVLVFRNDMKPTHISYKKMFGRTYNKDKINKLILKAIHKSKEQDT